MIPNISKRQTEVDHLSNNLKVYTLATVVTVVGVSLVIISALGLAGGVIPGLAAAPPGILIGIMAIASLNIFLVWAGVIAKNCLYPIYQVTENGTNDIDPQQTIIDVCDATNLKQFKSLDMAYMYMEITETNPQLDSYRVIHVTAPDDTFDDDILIVGHSLGATTTTSDPVWKQYEKKQEAWKCYTLVKPLPSATSNRKYLLSTDESQSQINDATSSLLLDIKYIKKARGLALDKNRLPG